MDNDSHLQFEKCLDKMGKPQKAAFIATFILGFLIHFYMMSNKFYNYFEMTNIFSAMKIDQADTLSLGRWFLPVVSGIGSAISMPVVNGVVVLLVLSAVAYMLVDILHIRGILSAIFVGGMLVSFTGVCSYLSFGVNSDVSSMAIFFPTLAVWCTEKYKKGFIFGILFICLGVATYQPFLSVGIAVIYCILLVDSLFGKVKLKGMIRKTLKYFGILLAGFALYYIVLKVITAITGIAVSNYHGVNEMTSFTLKGIAKGLVYSYGYFLSNFFTLEYTNSIILIVINIVLAICFFAMMVRHLINKKDKTTSIISIILLCFLPLGINATPFLMADRVGAGVDRYMLYSVVFLYVIVIKLLDTVDWNQLFKSYKVNMFIQWATVMMLFGVIVTGFYTSNKAYHRMEAMTNSIDSLLTRVAYRLETTGEWSPKNPIFLANCDQVFNENYEVTIPEYDAITNVEGTELKPWYNYNAMSKYMEVYLHFPIELPSEEQMESIIETDDFKEMPIYPAQDSIQEIDGVMVVKFN